MRLMTCLTSSGSGIRRSPGNVSSSRKRSLVKHGDYALCLEYLGDSEAAFRPYPPAVADAKTAGTTHGKRTQSKRQSPPAEFHLPSPPKVADRQFVDETCQLILILVKTEHKTDAEHIRDQALGLVDDPRLKSAVSDAEQAPVKQ